MICQYCGHKLTDGKCTYPACPGRLRREEMSEKKVHYLKTWPEPFRAVVAGIKRADFRLNDRDYHVGDTIVLEEFEPDNCGYTGKQHTVTITHIQDGFGIPDGYVMLSIDTPAPAEVERMVRTSQRGQIRPGRIGLRHDREGAGQRQDYEHDQCCKGVVGMKPDKCTSLTCQGPCEGCTTSHAVYEGGGWDRMGRYWMWEFKPYLGPIFLTAKGEPRVHQPGEKSPAWDVFEKWQKEKVDQPDPQPSALEVARNKIIRIQKHPQCTHAEYEAELTAILTEFKEAGR